MKHITLKLNGQCGQACIAAKLNIIKCAEMAYNISTVGVTAATVRTPN